MTDFVIIANIDDPGLDLSAYGPFRTHDAASAYIKKHYINGFVQELEKKTDLNCEVRHCEDEAVTVCDFCERNVCRSCMMQVCKQCTQTH